MEKLRKGFYFPGAVWEAMPACGIIYLYSRLLDTKGLGKAKISVSKAAEELGLKPQTVRLYLKQCLSKGLIRYAKKLEKGTHLIYYVGVGKLIAKQVGYSLEDLENHVDVGIFLDLPSLRQKKTVIPEAFLAHRQKQAQYAAFKLQQKLQEKKKPRVVELEEFLTGLESSHYEGAAPHVLRKEGRYTFVSQDCPSFGGTQQFVADALGKSRRTVNKRVSNKYREKYATSKNLPIKDLYRTQLLRFFGTEEEGRWMQASTFQEFGEYIPMIFWDGKAWICLPAVYDSPYVDNTLRRGTKRVKRLAKLHIKKLNQSSTPEADTNAA